MAQHIVVDQNLHIIMASHITIGRNTLDEWLARPRDLYMTTHNTSMRQTSM